MKKTVNIIIAVLFCGIDLSIEVNGVRRSFRRVITAALLVLAFVLASMSGVDAATPQDEQVLSVCIEQTAQGVAPSNAVNAAQARLLARRAAELAVIRAACSEVSAPRGRIREILSEEWQGNTCIITAIVQVFSR